MDELNQERIELMIEYSKTLIGAPYRWWIFDPTARTMDYSGSPFYVDRDYSIEYVMSNGTNCAGLINLMARKAGADPQGGTLMWIASNIKNLRPFDVTNIDEYQIGTLLIRSYRTETDQGHLAVYVGDGQIIHAYPKSSEISDDLTGPGVTLECIDESINWTVEPYYDFVVDPQHWLQKV